MTPAIAARDELIEEYHAIATARAPHKGTHREQENQVISIPAIAVIANITARRQSQPEGSMRDDNGR